MNHLQRLILQFPEKQWRWDLLLKNPNIDFQFYLENKSLFQYGDISANPNIVLEDVLSHPEIKWNFVELSDNENISMEEVFSHPEMDWKYQNMYWRTDITIHHILELERRGISISNAQSFWIVDANINLNDILSNPHVNWGDYVLFDYSLNKRCTLDEILSLPKESWNWDNLSMNESIPVSDIVKTPHLPWNWEFISERATAEDLLMYPNENWSEEWLQNNRNFTVTDWLNIPILRNLKITVVKITDDDVINHYNLLDKMEVDTTTLSLPVCLKYFGVEDCSMNPNLTYDFVFNNSDLNWSWSNISSNKFVN